MSLHKLLKHPSDSVEEHANGDFTVSIGETLTFTVKRDGRIWISAARPIGWEDSDMPLNEYARAKVFRDAFRKLYKARKPR